MKKFLTLMLVLFFGVLSMRAQTVAGLAFAQTNGTYTAFTDGTAFTTSATWDTQRAMVPLGFSFSMAGGAPVTQVYLSADGYISEAQVGAYSNPLSTTSASTFIIAGIGCDLQGQTGSDIRYKTIGVAPDRQFIVQWTNAKRYGSGYAGESLNYQIALFENGKVEIRYGAFINVHSNTSSTYDPHVGIRGITPSDFITRTTTTNWATSTAGTAIGNKMALNTTVFPANGLTFQFFPYPNIAPGAVTLVAPANAATEVEIPVQLQWTPDLSGTFGKPTGYKVYVGTDNPPTNVVNGTLVTDLFYSATTLNVATTYNWKIVATNAQGDGPSSPVWSFSTANYGSLKGIVYSNDGTTPVQGATVAVSPAVAGITPLTTGANGAFDFGVNTLPVGTYTLGAQAPGYTTTTVPNVVIVNNTVTTQNITLQRPIVTFTPNPINQVLNPNEYYTGMLNISNTGTGTLDWTATLGSWSSGNHDWFTFEKTTGSVAPGMNENVAITMSAADFEAGATESVIISFEYLGTTVEVPVSMIVLGDPLEPVYYVSSSVTNQLTGATIVSWGHTAAPGFQYYAITRDGVQVHVATSGNSWNGDVLPAYGTYEYCVIATYENGSAVPVCAEPLEWSTPSLSLDPAALADTLFSGENRPIGPVRLTLTNDGEGTLSYKFPDYPLQVGGLTYCAATATTCDEYISRVQFNTIDNASNCGKYSDFTSIETTVTPGNTYLLSLTNPSPWGSDIFGAWFDWNQDGDFGDAGESFTLGGTTSLATASIIIPTTAVLGKTTMRVRVQYGGALAPCGTTSYGEVEDYTVIVGGPVEATFITQVVPDEGVIAGGASKEIAVWFGADVAPFDVGGVYTANLALITNDAANATVSIPATMTVVVPGTIAGTVTEVGSGNPLQNVMVSVENGPSVLTNASGAYTLNVAPGGPFDVTFSLLGYASQTHPATVTANNTVTLNVQLSEEPVKPNCASATVNAEDTQALVEWCVPHAPYQLGYDDGEAENFASWQDAGNMNAVKFTPKGYPAKVEGASFFIGDGTYPEGGVVLGQPFDIVIYAADGENGMPGTELGTTSATVENFGWITVTGIEATVASGDFYVAVKQMTAAPNCVPVGIDETLPKAYKSYSINVTAGSQWVLSPYQDFMIQAIVRGPLTRGEETLSTEVLHPQKVSGLNALYPANISLPGTQSVAANVTPAGGIDPTDAVSTYSLQRLAIANPELAVTAPGNATPEGGIVVNLTGTTYEDSGTSWSQLPQGWYAYCIKAVYAGGVSSECAYTNVVPHGLNADLTFNVQLICGFVPAEGASITLVGQDYPFETYTMVVPTGGTATFNNVLMGRYDVKITYTGYYAYNDVIDVTGDLTQTIILEDVRSAPKNLFVDEMTLHATWEESKIELVNENFEGTVFPPTGWTATTLNATAGWFASNDGGSTDFPIPAHTTYAVVNDDMNDGDSSKDYLITPALDLTSSPSFVLSFASYFTGAYSSLATIEISTDGGTTFTQIYSVPVGSWTTVEVDLSAYSGATGYSNAKIAFRHNDQGEWASGWAIDDVVIGAGGVEHQGYQFFLDNAIIGPVLPPTQLEYDIPPSAVQWGQTYVAGVAAIYCSGYSDQATYTFTSKFLPPPVNLTAQDYSSPSALSAKLMWEPPAGVEPPPPPGGNVTVILEAHDLWGDGTGYQLLLDKDATAFGTTIPATGPLAACAGAPATLYDVFESKIPEAADPVCTTTNVVVDGTATITMPSGTYDFCVVNPTPGQNLWIAGGDNARKDDYVFEAGKTYHFTAAMAGSGDAITINISKDGVTQSVDYPSFYNNAPGMQRVSDVVTTPNPNSERSGLVNNNSTVTPTRALWDLLLNLATHSTAGEYGVASDGNFIYSGHWNATTFSKYNMDGTWVEDFTISGAGSCRDLAYSATTGYFYGSPNSTSIYEMDFVNKTLVSTKTTTGSVRHIAYSKDLDGGNGGFYVGAWTDIKSIKMDGSLIANGPAVTSVSGSAYDPVGKKLYVSEGGGALPHLMRQIDPATFAYTDISHDMSDIGYASDGVSGGLDYVKYNGKHSLVGIIQNEKLYVYSLAAGGSGPGPQPTEGLIAYRLYRDGVAITPDVSADSLYRFDNGMTPGHHCWDITAVYELSAFGFPGQTAESMFALETKPCLDMVTGHQMPFVEDWTTGQFDVNGWLVGENWIMDGQLGNPLPSARFKWDPELSDYSSSLTSAYINGSLNTMTPYKVKLDFDVKFDDRNQTTAEKLNVEVSNNAGTSWISVAEFTSNGDFDWMTESVDITSYAKGKTFQIRFNANGTLSSDIVYWAVDNIKVYPEWTLAAPTNLTATRQGTPEDDILVKWDGFYEGPAPVQSEWLHYDDGVNSDAIGLTNGGEFSCAIKYSASDLTNYQGWNVKKIKFFPNANGTYKLRIWQGTSLVVDQAVTAPVIGMWNEVDLTTPFTIANQDYYFGYNVAHDAGQYPAGVDAGPAHANGDLLSQDNGANWQHLADLGLPNNWNIQVYVESAKGAVIQELQPIVVEPINNVNSTIASNPLPTSFSLESRTTSDVVVGENGPTEDFTGYDLYRRAYLASPAGPNTGNTGEWAKLNTSLLADTFYLDQNLSNDVTNCYEYYVKAVYAEGESEPSNIDSDCIYVGIDLSANEVRVYPNPAINYVNISVTQDINSIVIYNVLGSKVVERTVKGQNEFTISTRNFAPGAYSIKFIGNDGSTFSRKFVVTK